MCRTNRDWAIADSGADFATECRNLKVTPRGPKPRAGTSANKVCPAMTLMSRCKMLHSWKAKKMTGAPSYRARRPEGRQPSV